MKKILFLPLLLIAKTLFAQDIEKELDAPSVSETKRGNDGIFTSVEKMPEYPGGEQEFYLYIANNVQYPQSAVADGIAGVVYVQFVVKKTGKIDDVEVSRGVREDLDQAAIDVVKSMRDWIPGEHKGEKINVLYTIPISFSLK